MQESGGWCGKDEEQSQENSIEYKEWPEIGSQKMGSPRKVKMGQTSLKQKLGRGRDFEIWRDGLTQEDGDSPEIAINLKTKMEQRVLAIQP